MKEEKEKIKLTEFYYIGVFALIGGFISYLFGKATFVEVISLTSICWIIDIQKQIYKWLK